MMAVEGDAALQAADPPERAKNDLNTPAEFLEPLAALGPVYLDPCSNRWSIVGAIIALDGSCAATDGLLVDWYALTAGQLVFVNPPYGRGCMRPWAHKVVHEARAGCEIVELTPVSPTTAWWKHLRQNADAMVLLGRRLPFGGGTSKTGRIDSAAFYFGPRPFLFAQAFYEHGDVRVFGGAS